MHILSFKVVMLLRMFLGVVLIALLTGCNSSAGTLSLASALARAHSADTTPADLSLNRDESFYLSSLNIHAGAFACPMDNFLRIARIQSSPSAGNVVLINTNTTYDAGAVANLAASIDKDDPSLLPSGFEAILGAFVDSNGSGWCDSIWEITNTSPDTPVTITQIALRYAADSQPNTYHYSLIDLCSLPIQMKASICSGGRGGGGGVQNYTFRLGTGSNGTIVSSQETGSLSIDPGATVTVELVVVPADKSNPDYIYSIVPQLTIDTSSQPQDVSQMISTVAFTNSSQVSCYQLQSDNTFLQMNNPPIPVGQDKSNNFVECV